MTMTEEPTVTTTIDKLPSAEELAEIADPRERLHRAAEVAAAADEQADKHRERRNAAGLQLFAAGNLSAAAVWRDTLGISRSLWSRIVKDEDIKVGTYADPAGVARREAELTRKFDRLATDAQKVRDETARELMNSQGVPNADVARITGLTTARIAQLRTSY